jgi:sugar/nucleoside kinase (ribokinase family)
MRQLRLASAVTLAVLLAAPAARAGRSRLLIVGSAAVDTITTADGVRKERLLGGSAVYAALAAAKGSRPLMVAPIGRDFPAKYVKLMQRQGVNTSSVERSNGLSFAWTGRYLNSKDRVTVETQLGVLGQFKPRIPVGYQPTHVFLANMAPEQQLQVLAQLEGRPRIIVDTMNLWIDKSLNKLLQVVRRADVLLLNDEEAPMLTGRDDLREAAARVLELGPRMVIIKQGKNGASLFYKEAGTLRSFTVPVYPVKVKDTTGAGDSFGGALLSYVSRQTGFGPRQVGMGMVYAAAVASSTVTDFSVAGLTRLSQRQIDKRFAQLSAQVKLSDLPRR